MLVKVLKPFRYPSGGEWLHAEGGEADVPEDQVESLAEQGLIAKPPKAPAPKR